MSENFVESLQSQAARATLGSALGRYFEWVEEQVSAALFADKRMPRTIDYLQHYAALRQMDSTDDVLAGLNKTLSLAGDILRGGPAEGAKIDADAALKDAAASYVGYAMVLSAGETGIVEEAGESSGDASETVGSDLRSRAFKKKEGFAGRLHFDSPQPFRPDSACRLVGSAKETALLLNEVRTSFDTFSRVVRDNGLLAAFSTDTTSGACRPEYWWIFFSSRTKEDDFGEIPYRVEECPDGDTLQQSIERMKGFNKQKYLDFFDDDITQHIDAFWYGFAKLMQNVNGLYHLDMSGFNEYCEGVVEAVTRSALDFYNAFGSKVTMEFAADIETLTK